MTSQDRALTGMADLPIRDDLRGREPYGAPQLAAAVRLNTNENPYPPSPRLTAAIGAAVAEVAGTLNRYPDRDATELRKDLADYLGHGLTARQVWAATRGRQVPSGSTRIATPISGFPCTARRPRYAGTAPMSSS